MGAISFFEKTADTSSAYFRHLGILLAIRDLWTKLQFELLKVFLEVKVEDAQSTSAARDRLCSLAEAFCRDLDKLASDELTAWRTEFKDSLAELDAAAKKGTEDTQTQLTNAVKAIEKASVDAAKAAEEAAKPAFIKIKIEGAFDEQDKVAILIDDAQVALTHLRSFPIDRVRPGHRKIEARAKRGGKDVQAADIKEIKAGAITEVPLTLE
jgi:hypothetical protein